MPRRHLCGLSGGVSLAKTAPSADITSFNQQGISVVTSQLFYRASLLLDCRVSAFIPNILCTKNTGFGFRNRSVGNVAFQMPFKP